MTFARAPLTLDAAGLARLCATVDTGGYGLVLISSWQAVFRGLVRDENDNAGSVRVVEDVKAAARASKVPWLIDAHSAVRVRTRTTMLTRARRSGAPPARPAPQTSPSRSATPTGLSARSGAWAGNGRFVWFEPVTLDHNLATGTYTALGETKTVASEETWRRLVETGAVTTTPRTAGEIARVAGMVSKDGTPTTRISARSETRSVTGRACSTRKRSNTASKPGPTAWRARRACHDATGHDWPGN